MRLWAENQSNSNVVQRDHSVRPLNGNGKVNSSDVQTYRSRSRSPMSQINSEIHKIVSNDLRNKLKNIQNIRVGRWLTGTWIMCYNCGNDHPIRKCP